MDDAYFMRQAMLEAQKAAEVGEVPIGAVITFKNKIIARAHNLTETLVDVTAHAEMQAFTSASNTLGSKYLDLCTLFVSLEPCPMCAGAAYWTRIGRLVYAAKDSKRGFSSLGIATLHPKTIVESGIMEEESIRLLQTFFKAKR